MYVFVYSMIIAQLAILGNVGILTCIPGKAVLHCTYSMRSILTLSLPADMMASLKKKAGKAGMSVSAYVRRIIIFEEEGLISEDDLQQRAHEAKKSYDGGNVKELQSFKDLD